MTPVRRSAVRVCHHHQRSRCSASASPLHPQQYAPRRLFNAPSTVPPLRHPPFSPISRPALQTTNTFSSSLKSIGNTPLIKLKKASELTGCNIYGKAEYTNPGGSVKDRAALWIVKDAEERGLLEPGHGLIVEGTAGNTGIGLALVGNARGYQTVICIADTQSREKKDILRWSGASLLEVPAVPFANPKQLRSVRSPAQRRTPLPSGWEVSGLTA